MICSRLAHSLKAKASIRSTPWGKVTSVRVFMPVKESAGTVFMPDDRIRLFSVVTPLKALSFTSFTVSGILYTVPGAAGG